MAGKEQVQNALLLFHRSLQVISCKNTTCRVSFLGKICGNATDTAFCSAKFFKIAMRAGRLKAFAKSANTIYSA